MRRRARTNGLMLAGGVKVVVWVSVPAGVEEEEEETERRGGGEEEERRRRGGEERMPRKLLGDKVHLAAARGLHALNRNVYIYR
jgi:hypothetical protein